MEKINENFYKEKPRFFIKKENIIPLEKLMDVSDKKEVFERLNWPLEVQGSGRVIEGNNFEIRYPKGDKFFSFAVIIHELGHLRQDEFIDVNNIDSDAESLNIRKEKDAFARGWQRVNKYCPEAIKKLDQELQEYKNQAKIEDFESFEELYNFFNGTVGINLALDKLAEDASPEEQIATLKQAGVDKFFNKIKRNKVGEVIRENEADELIIRVAEQIFKE